MMPNNSWKMLLTSAFMAPVKHKIMMSTADVTGEERYFVIAEGLPGEKKEVVYCITTLEEAKQLAASVKSRAVSIVKQIGYGFSEEW